MKITIERAALLKALAHVQSVVERRNTIPILSNVLMEAKGGKLRLNATDMDLSIVEQVPAEVETAGATTAPAHTLYDIVRKLPDGAEVGLSTEGSDGQMVLSAGRSTFTLSTLPKEDFPAGNSGELPTVFALEAQSLKDLVDRTRFAISTEETRYYLNGIYLHDTKVGDVSLLRAVATDGHRLARFEMALPDGGAGMPGVIVPRKAVAEVRKLLEECEGPVEVALSDTRIRFSFDSTVLTSKLIDGTFPDYQRVIPKIADKAPAMTVEVKALGAALRRASSLNPFGRTEGVTLALSDDGRLILVRKRIATGTSREIVPATVSGPPIIAALDGRYLQQMFKAHRGSGTITLRFIDAGSPVSITSEREGFNSILMPMRTGSEQTAREALALLAPSPRLEAAE